MIVKKHLNIAIFFGPKLNFLSLFSRLKPCLSKQTYMPYCCLIRLSYVRVIFKPYLTTQT